MVPQSYERKLTAILSADVAGYSRLMGEDDEATVSALTGHRKMMVSLIEQHKGRVVDSPGDNLLAGFSSVLNAVNCSAEIQREFAERNAELPEDRRMEFRIGVNVGDVIEEGDRIYGDGVNIAARLEGLAESGGICISGFVYHQVKSRLKLEYEFIGEQSVKNIKEPVPVYRVLSLPGAAAHRVIKAKKAMRLSPCYAAVVLRLLGHIYFFLDRYEEAIAAFTQLDERARKGEYQTYFAPLYLALVYEELGREEEARAYITEALKSNRNFSLKLIVQINPFKNPAHLQRELDALRKAGLPEKAPGAVQ